MKRVFLIVLDSLGIGQMPDANQFGDKDCNTLKRISQSKFFRIPNLLKLGLGHIEGNEYLPYTQAPAALVARMCEASKGKDTTIGHWEIAGLISNSPLPTYPDGFPADVIEKFSTAVGRGVLCNRPYSGTQVIADYGKEHLQTGSLIIYTSADSVFQIAAHESVVSTEKLYEYCKIAREILHGEHAVGRVIARPFAGECPDFFRTSNRRDFSLTPPNNTLLDDIINGGKSVYAVGKIADIFAGKGISHSFLTHSNQEGMSKTLELLQTPFEGLCFVNLVDFDMLYGHRQDIDGYAKALSEFDGWLPQFLQGMQKEDLLIITADHGCDPGDESTDHSREYTPMLCYQKGEVGGDLGTCETFADIAATVAEYLSVSYDQSGTSIFRRKYERKKTL